MASTTLTADLLVIGFGKGGKTLAGQQGRAGKRVVLVEQSAEMYGGTCINIGCVPTKALVHLANERRPGDPAPQWYGEAIGTVQDLTSLLRAKNFSMLDDVDTVTVVTGRAHFLDPHTVEVTAGTDTLTVTAETIVINTGATPVMPPIPALTESSRVVTSTELLQRAELPRRLAIIGGGYLGIEFASMYREFGAEVTLLEAGPTLLGREDDDVRTAAVDILTAAGIGITCDASVTAVRDSADGVTVTYDHLGSAADVEADVVLVAVGRAPNTAGLDLAAAGVEVTDRGAVQVDACLRTAQPHIYAVGDVNGGPQFTYISLDDSRIVADSLAGTGARSVDDRRAVPTTTFMTPPLSSVGLTEHAAVAAGHAVRIAAKPVAQIAAMPRARIVGDTRGLIKFVIDDRTDLILGATLLCVDSQELINTVALAMRHGVTATELRDTIYTHPSATEAFNEVLATSVVRN